MTALNRMGITVLLFVCLTPILVGYTKLGDHDWFLIKDSASSAQHGKFKGYWFYREDYIKLKMLTFIVHKDAVKGVLSNFD